MMTMMMMMMMTSATNYMIKCNSVVPYRKSFSLSFSAKCFSGTLCLPKEAALSTCAYRAWACGCEQTPLISTIFQSEPSPYLPFAPMFLYCTHLIFIFLVKHRGPRHICSALNHHNSCMLFLMCWSRNVADQFRTKQHEQSESFSRISHTDTDTRSLMMAACMWWIWKPEASRRALWLMSK